MVRSYSQTWFITKDNVRRTNTREKSCGRPRTMFLDWLLKTEEDKISYDELKMLAQDRSRCRQWRWKPATWAEYYSSSSSSCWFRIYNILTIGQDLKIVIYKNCRWHFFPDTMYKYLKIMLLNATYILMSVERLTWMTSPFLPRHALHCKMVLSLRYHRVGDGSGPSKGRVGLQNLFSILGELGSVDPMSKCLIRNFA